ncbi:Hypp3166 [Branchiostoma lanceolatum]|uniref:Hypp3166 protein n=1 Tax=Branchiostoma lanceolatum TaxID=7740 RepID=A0A8J9ZYQ9_BRALA|nr:Hypp3166 [Branchiostoma lanceolatum]
MFPINLLPYVLGTALVLLGAIVFFWRAVLYQGLLSNDEEQDTQNAYNGENIEASPTGHRTEQSAVNGTEQ